MEEELIPIEAEYEEEILEPDSTAQSTSDTATSAIDEKHSAHSDARSTPSTASSTPLDPPDAHTSDTSLENKPRGTLDVLKKYGINLRQEMFCQYYTSGSEFFGNGVQSYAAAYDREINSPAEFRAVSIAAGNLLKNEKIIARVNSLLDEAGLNDFHVDKQLLFLINQGADFNSKLGAIREYNKMRKRTSERITHTFEKPVEKIEIEVLEPLDNPDSIEGTYQTKQNDESAATGEAKTEMDSE